MFTEERQQKIISIVNEHQSISVNNLTDMLGFSPATIRSDLNELSKKGLLVRTHGGATAIKNQKKEAPSYENFGAREKENHAEKVDIAKKAINLINEDTCIILDASSTAFELAKLINTSSIRLMVITNGIKTANLLKNNTLVTTILIGGALRGNSNAIEGTLGVGILKEVNIDTAFLSAHAFNLKDGMTDFNLYEVELKKKFIEEIDMIFAMIDHTKLNQTSTASFASPSQINTLITNIEKVDSTLINEYKNNGLKII